LYDTQGKPIDEYLVQMRQACRHLWPNGSRHQLKMPRKRLMQQEEHRLAQHVGVAAGRVEMIPIPGAVNQIIQAL
jgi:hypothetical protein